MTMPFRLSAVAGLILLGAMANAGAETTTDRYGKELKIEPSRNIFARFGLLGFKMNNKSEAARDVSGSVLSAPANTTTPTAGDRGWYCSTIPFDTQGNGLSPCLTTSANPIPADAADEISATRPATIYSGDINSRTSTIYQLFHDVGSTDLGLPDDVKARIADPKPGAIGTVGMYFDEDHKWAIEVPVMALPFEIDIYGAGSFQNAGKIITGKTLGFLVFGHYYFGQKADKFRPSVSLTANYLLPYDMQATQSLEQWTGGRTKVSSTASLGFGWLVGGKYALNDRWDLNFNFGQFKAKVESTLVTYDTEFKWNSPIFTYWPGQLGANIRSLQARGSASILSGQLRDIMTYRNYDVANRVNGGANLGTFTRKQTQTLDPYVMMMTVGYNF